MPDRIDQLRAFIAAQPDEPFPRYALALELKGRGDLAGADSELSELLRRKPDYLAAYLQRGMVQQALSQIEAARATFQQGQDVARRQGNSHTLSELTSALETLG